MTKKIYFRTDASLQIGTGHVMRCLTLAKELKDRGAEVCFICRSHPGNLNELIRNNGFEVLELNSPSNKNQEELAILSPRGEYGKWLGVTWERDAQETLSALGKEQPDWLIVDHYALDKAWESTLRPKVEKIMVIDDLADREHDCDLLLDQNFYLEPQSRYSNLVPLSCAKLLGPEFALLRPEFQIARDNKKKRTQDIKRVFLFFGGSDQENCTSKALFALMGSNLKDLYVDVVIGVNNPHRILIESLVKKRKKTMLYIQIDNMAELMSKADLAIGGAGTTSWERLSLCLPAIVIIQAENQKIIAENLDKTGVIKVIKLEELNSEKIEEIISGEWINSFALKENLKQIGNGTVLVADRITKKLSSEKIFFLVSDKTHPVLKSLNKIKIWGYEAGFEIEIINSKAELLEGKFLFLISCGEKVEVKYRDLFEKVFVIHASDLPQGRGWSPYIWDILEGKSELTLSLIEAVDEIDCGDIWAQSKIKLEGHELLDEILNKIFEEQEVIIKNILINYKDSEGKKQKGNPGKYFRKRTPMDSALDINKTIDENFNLLRVVDNERFPAFFYKNGCKYIVRIKKDA